MQFPGKKRVKNSQTYRVKASLYFVVDIVGFSLVWSCAKMPQSWFQYLLNCTLNMNPEL